MVARARRAVAGLVSAVLNVTAAGPDGAGCVRAYPCATRPFVSNGNIRAGRVCLSLHTSPDLVVDLAGGYTG